MWIVKVSHLFLLMVIVYSVSCNVTTSANVSESPDNEHDITKATLDVEDKSVKTTSLDDIKVNSTRKEIVSTFTSNSQRSKFSQSKSNAPSDIQIPVSVIYDTPVAPSKQDKLKSPSSRYRKIRRLHEDRQFESRVEESLAKRYEVTTFRPRNSKPNSVADLIKQNTQPISTEEAQKMTREKDPVVAILEENNKVYSDKGEFHYNYVSGDGTTAFERGEFKHPVTEDKPKSSVKGGFSYTDKDGNDFSLSYTADENGYHPVGAHLPTPPPIPPAIARALEYLATKPTEEHVTYSYIDY